MNYGEPPSALHKLPPGWTVERLKHVTDVWNSNVNKKAAEDEQPVRLCNYTDVYYREYITSDLPLMEATASKAQIERFSLKSGDVIITKDSESWDDIAVPACATGDFDDVVCGYHLTLLRPKSGLIYGPFLLRALQSSGIKEQFYVAAKGITRYGLSLHHIENAFIPVPPLDQQRRVAAYLDRKTREIDTLIQKKQALIDLLKEQRTAIINRAVTNGLDPDVPMKDSGIEWLGEVPKHWKLIKLAHFVEKMTNGYVGPTRNILKDQGVPYIQSLHIKGNTVRFHKPYYVSEEWSMEHSRTILREDDVLVVQTGAIGEVGIVPKEFDGANCHALIILRARSDMGTGKFLLYALASDYGYHSLMVMRTGALHPHLNTTYIRDVLLAVPPINEQEAIVDYIRGETQKIDRVIRREKKTIELLKELRTSLISEVVTGKIDVRVTRPAELEVSTITPTDVKTFEWWVLANHVLRRMASSPHFGRITLVKVLFVLQYEMRLRLTAERYKEPYQRWDFGPFNPKMIHALEASLESQDFWQKTTTQDEQQVRYVPLSKADDPDDYFERYWGDRKAEVDGVVDLFMEIISGRKAAERAEIVATLYAAWNDLLIAGREPTDTEIVREARENWHEAKLRIKPKRWHRGLDWMRERGLIPVGFGQPVVHRQDAA